MSAERRNEERKKREKREEIQTSRQMMMMPYSVPTQYFEVRRRFHAKFSFFEFGSFYKFALHNKNYTSQIYRQLTSTPMFFLRRGSRCFLARPADFSRADFPFVEPSRGGCLAALECE